ncbi:insulinase family protein [bacterium]|nr:MAG: insulinase family protein [bacterium]
MKTALMLTVCALLATGSSTLLGGPTVSDDSFVLLPVKNDPTVSFRMIFLAGSQNDPAGKEGLAAVTASMLTDAATQRNSYEQILDKLYPLAASYSAATTTEMSVIYGRTHRDNLKEYYPLLMDAVLRPAFKQDDLDRIKSQMLNYLENTLRYASDEELGKAVLYTRLFAGTGYGHITPGLAESVRSITLADVQDFYKKFYTVGDITVGVGGGYDQALIDNLKRDLGGLPASGSRAAAPKPKTIPLDGFDVTMVEKDAPATAISMGFPIDVLRGTKDWYALAIANSWLGEHRNSSSHLYQVIREERGLNYGDYSYIEYYPGGGGFTVPPQNVARRQQIFEMWIRPVPNETRHFALRAALREFQKLVNNGLSESEFQLTRGFLSKYVLHYAPTTMERLGYALDDRFYGIKGSHLETFREMMKTLTREDVNAAVKKHLRYGKMAIAIVTKDAKSFKEALVSDAPSPITYKTPKPESVLSEDKEIGTFPVKVKPEDVKIVKVEELFQK